MDFLDFQDLEVTFDTVNDTFPTTRCFEICILNDDILEPREEFRLIMSAAFLASNVVVLIPRANVIITDSSGED